MRIRLVSATACICLNMLVAGCAQERSLCAGLKVFSPSESCAAYYYETPFNAEQVLTQAIVECDIDGQMHKGSILSSHSEYSSVIGFRWQSDRELDVLINYDADMPSIELGSSRTDDNFGRQITYNFLPMDKDADEWNDCNIQ